MLCARVECLGHQLLEHRGRYSSVVFAQLRRTCIHAGVHAHVPNVKEPRDVRTHEALRYYCQFAHPYLVRAVAILQV